MAFPTRGAEIVLSTTLGSGQEASTVLHALHESADPNQGELTSLATVVASWWVEPAGAPLAIQSFMANNVLLNTVTATARGLVPQLQSVIDVNDIGDLVGGTVPPETSLVTTWYTGTVGRSYRGRTFWPGLADSNLDADGLWQSGVVATLDTTMGALLDEVEDGTNFKLAVYSRLLGVMTNITSTVTRSTPHHQKRRNP